MENLITQMLVKISLFVANKIFRKIIVWLHVDLHILHTVTVWQDAELTKAHLKISLFRTNIVSRDFINILTYAKCVTCHRIAEFLNELSEWNAECSKTHLHKKEVEAWLIANLTTQML